MTRKTPSKLGGSLVLLALSLGACAPDRVVTGSVYPVDYQARHPIALAHTTEKIDVFVPTGGLDPRQRDDVASFALSYRRHGEGALTAQVPKGVAAGPFTHRALAIIRAALSESGVPGDRIVVTSYTALDPTVAAPIRLSFRRLEAKVLTQCGLWPQDLGVSDAGFNARNEPYWNLGCAMQSNVAAQVADPVDLVRGRTEARVDTIRRMRNIEKLRQGVDPSTEYRAEDDKISKALSN